MSDNKNIDDLNDELNQLRESFAEQRDQINRLTGMLIANAAAQGLGADATAAMAASMTRGKAASDNLSGSYKKGQQDADNLFKGFGELTEAQKHHAAAVKEATKMEQLRKSAMADMQTAMGSLSGSLLTAGGGLAKYNTTLDKGGDALASFASQFGKLGAAVGLMINASTFVAKQTLTYADNLLKASDELASFGAAGTLTTEQIREMGKGALYTTTTIGGWTKATKSLGTDIMGLSNTVTGGVGAFAELTTLTREQYNAYQAMGFSQEQLTQAQADSVKYLMKSGVVVTDKMKADGTLKKMTLEYTDSLIQLSALTGDSVENLKKQKDAALQNVAVQVMLMQWDQKKKKLEEEALQERDPIRQAELTAQAEQIGKNRKNTEEMLTIAKDKMSAEKFAALQYVTVNESFNEASSMLAAGSEDMVGYVRAIKNGTLEANTIGPKLAKDLERNVASFNAALTLGDGSAAKAVGVEIEDFANRTRNANRTIAEADAAGKEAKRKQELAVKGKGPAAEDDAQGWRAKQNEAENKIQNARDSLIATLGLEVAATLGVIVGLGALTAAAIMASKALGAMGGGSLLDALKTAGKRGKGGPKLPTAKPTGGMSAGQKTKYDGLRAGGMGASDAKAAAVKAAPVPTATPAGPSKGAGALKALGRFAGPVAGGLAVAEGAHTAYTGYNAVEEQFKKGEISKKESTVKKSEAVGEGVGSVAGGAAGAWAGAGSGAAIGGAIGSVVPILGTAIGAALGGIIGGGLGAWGGSTLGGKAGKGVGGVTGAALASDKTKEQKAVPPGTAITEANAAKVLSKDIKDLTLVTKDSTEDEKKKKEDLVITLDKTIGSLGAFSNGLFNATKSANMLAEALTKATQPTEQQTARPGPRTPEDARSIPEARELGATTPQKPHTDSPVVARPPGAAGKPGKFAGFGKDVDVDIKDAAKKYGMDEKTLRGFIKMEGGWTGKMSPTGAIGTGQFIQSTWDSLAKSKEGQEIGMRKIGKDFRTANDPRFDKRTNTMATALLAKQNAEILVKAGLEPTGENLYMLHNIGPGVIPALKGQPVSEKTMLAMRQNGMKAGQSGADFAKMQKEKFNTQSAMANQPNLGQPEVVTATAKPEEKPRMPQARNGGIFSGPESGFPVELHGNEVVTPFDPSSLLAKLMLAPASETMAKATPPATALPPVDTGSQSDTSVLTAEMFEMLSDKFDTMIDKLSSLNTTQDEILTYSR